MLYFYCGFSIKSKPDLGFRNCYFIEVSANGKYHALDVDLRAARLPFESAGGGLRTTKGKINTNILATECLGLIETLLMLRLTNQSLEMAGFMLPKKLEGVLQPFHMKFDLDYRANEIERPLGIRPDETGETTEVASPKMPLLRRQINPPAMVKYLQKVLTQAWRHAQPQARARNGTAKYTLQTFWPYIKNYHG